MSKALIEIPLDLKIKLDTLSQTMCIPEEDLIANYLFQGINKDINTLSSCYTQYLMEDTEDD